MLALPETIVLPIKMDEHGVIHVSSTRITLDTIIACHHQGDSPEAVHEGFTSIPLTDIYAVIAYYLAHQAEVDAYIKARAASSSRIRTEVEANYSPEQKARTEYFRNILAKKGKEQEQET